MFKILTLEKLVSKKFTYNIRIFRFASNISTLKKYTILNEEKAEKYVKICKIETIKLRKIT